MIPSASAAHTHMQPAAITPHMLHISQAKQARQQAQALQSDSMIEVEEQEQVAPASTPAPAPTTLRVVIIRSLYKAAGAALCLWLSSPLWLQPVKAALGWATQHLQYLAAFALVAAALAHIPYRLPIPAICSWVARCTCPISLVHMALMRTYRCSG